MNNKYILTLKNVSKIYGNKKAIDSFNMNICSGKIYGLLGPNGSGKTTLIRIINMIQKPDTGVIIFKNRPLNIEDALKMGYLPEERGLYKNMNVEEQLIFLSELKGMTRIGSINRIKKLFYDLNIDPSWKYKNVSELSKGMAQKIQFLVSIIHSPNFITLDEPFSGLDPLNIKIISNYIFYLKKKGVTILLSTHNMSFIEKICDHILFIYKSKKIFDSPLFIAKQNFKKNIFKVEINIYNKILWNKFCKKQKIFNIKYYENDRCNFMLYNKNESYKILLNKLIDIGYIISYQEYIPSISEIFFKILMKSEKNISNY